MRSSSAIQLSSSKVPEDITGLSVQSVTIDQVSELAIFKRVAITAKVVLVCAREQVYNGK